MTDSLPEWVSAEALALQTTEQLADIYPSGCWRFPRVFGAAMRWRTRDPPDLAMCCRIATGLV
jgi:hypothetical protein